jgi:hypothetical protein
MEARKVTPPSTPGAKANGSNDESGLRTVFLRLVQSARSLVRD